MAPLKHILTMVGLCPALPTRLLAEEAIKNQPRPNVVWIVAFGTCLHAFLSVYGLSPAVHAANLACDASFESPLSPWFAERAGTSYYAGKERVDNAVDGHRVLAIQAWEKGGSRILSQPVSLPRGTGQDVFSAVASIRTFGTVENTTIELAIFDEKGKKQLGSFGTLPFDGKGEWQKLSRAGLDLENPINTCRLAREECERESRGVGPVAHRGNCPLRRRRPLSDLRDRPQRGADRTVYIRIVRRRRFQERLYRYRD